MAKETDTKAQVPVATAPVVPPVVPTKAPEAAKAEAAVAEPPADLELEKRLAGYPLAKWDENDPYAAEKRAMLDCVTGRRMTRPKGAEGLLRRLRATGTGAYNLERFFGLLPTDRYGKRTGDDLPADFILDEMLKVIEWDESHTGTFCDETGGAVAVPTLDRFTYEKALQIAKKGYWSPQAVYRHRLTKAIADEVYDPDAEDEDDETDKKLAKKSRAKVSA